VSVTYVLLKEKASSPLAGSPSWVTVAPPVVVILVVVAGALLTGALLPPRSRLPAGRRRIPAPASDPAHAAARRRVEERV
jgi:hypothetical protein